MRALCAMLQDLGQAVSVSRVGDAVDLNLDVGVMEYRDLLGRGGSFSDLRAQRPLPVIVLMPPQCPRSELVVDGMTFHYLVETSPPEEVCELILSVTERRGTESSAPSDSPTKALSPREWQVLSNVAKGLTHDQIARRLGISAHTVDTYLRRVRFKLRLGNKAELTRAALELASGWQQVSI
jgi:DNA-binding NarL/FixJ family response regulator